MTERFTDAQLRALDWLPSDGSWRSSPGRLSAALNSLAFRHKGLLEIELEGQLLRYRLTESGKEMKARLP